MMENEFICEFKYILNWKTCIWKKKKRKKKAKLNKTLTIYSCKSWQSAEVRLARVGKPSQADLVLPSFPMQRSALQEWRQGAGPMKSRVPKHPVGKHFVTAVAVSLGHYLSAAWSWQPTGHIPHNTVRSWCREISFLCPEREQKSWGKDLVSCSSLWGSMTSQVEGGSWETTAGSHFIKGSRTTEKMPC